MDVVDPSTDEQVESYEEHSRDEVEAALGRTDSAFAEWRERPLREREELPAAAGAVLRENKQGTRRR